MSESATAQADKFAPLSAEQPNPQATEKVTRSREKVATLEQEQTPKRQKNTEAEGRAKSKC